MDRFDNARQENLDHVTEARNYNHIYKFDPVRDPTKIARFIRSAQRQEEGAIDAIARRIPWPEQSPKNNSNDNSFKSLSEDLSVPPEQNKRKSTYSIPVPVLSQQYELQSLQNHSPQTLEKDPNHDLDEIKPNINMELNGMVSGSPEGKRPHTTTQAEQQARHQRAFGIRAIRQTNNLVQDLVRAQSQPDLARPNTVQRTPHRERTPSRDAANNYPKML